MDAIEFGKGIGALVRDIVSKSIGEVVTRLAELEQRFNALPVPKDGASVTVDDVRPLVAEEIEKAVAALPAPKDGTSISVEELLPTLVDEVGKAVEALPKAKDGTSVTLEDVQPTLQAAVEEAVKSLPPAEPGKPGTSVVLEDVLPDLKQQVAEFLKAIPAPKDGTSVTVDEVVQALLPGIEKTLGSLHDRWALDFERRAQETLQRACAAIPKPKDGEDGADGLGFEDFTPEFDGERTLSLRFSRADVCKVFDLKLPHLLDRGVYREGAGYDRGDTVTFGGSLWVAQKDAPEGKPAEGSRDWRLAVKRGRDGKDAVVRTIEQPATVKVPKP